MTTINRVKLYNNSGSLSKELPISQKDHKHYTKLTDKINSRDGSRISQLINSQFFQTEFLDLMRNADSGEDLKILIENDHLTVKTRVNGEKATRIRSLKNYNIQAASEVRQINRDILNTANEIFNKCQKKCSHHEHGNGPKPSSSTTIDTSYQDSLLKEVSSAHNYIHKLQDDILKLKNDMEKLQSDLKSSTQENDSLTAENDSRTKAYNQLEEQYLNMVNLYKKENTRLNKELIEANNKTNNLLNHTIELQKKFNNLEYNYDIIHDENLDLHKEIKLLKEDLENKDKKIDEVVENSVAIRNLYDSLSEKYERLTNSYNSVKGEKQELNEKLSQQANQIADLTDQNNKLQKEIDELTKSLAHRDKAISVYVKENMNLSTQQKINEKTISEQANKINDLESHLDEQIKNNQALSEQATNLKNNVTMLTSNLTKSVSANKSSEAEIEQLNKDIKEKEKRIDEIKTNLNETLVFNQALLNTSKQANQEHTESLAKVRNESFENNLKLIKEIEQLKIEIDQLKNPHHISEIDQLNDINNIEADIFE